MPDTPRHADQLDPAIDVLNEGGAVLHPVAAVVVVDALHSPDGRHVGVATDDDRAIFQASPVELPDIDIHSL